MNEPNFYNATGPIDYNMTNDYMFRVILQENKTVLRGLIRSLLRMAPEEIVSVEITNPIILGETIEEKDFYLDVDVKLNNNTIINLEMQVENKKNWPDRSLNYLCRNFSQISKGQEYSETEPTIHIGFLDYTLFPEHPEFYAIFKLQNTKTHYVFSDKLMLGVVDLRRIDLATEEDKLFELDKWVALFKSKTWEDLRMIAKENPELQEASESLYKYNSEVQIRQRCWAREDYNKMIRTYERDIKQQAATIEEQALIIAELRAENERLKQQQQ